MTKKQSDSLNALLDRFAKDSMAVVICSADDVWGSGLQQEADASASRDAILAWVDAELKVALRKSAKRNGAGSFSADKA